jgi:hypothetical protein
MLGLVLVRKKGINGRVAPNGRNLMAAQKSRVVLLEICPRANIFDPLVGSDEFDPLWCKSPNGPQML